MTRYVVLHARPDGVNVDIATVDSQQEAIRVARRAGAVIHRGTPILNHPHDMRARPSANEAIWIEETA